MKTKLLIIMALIISTDLSLYAEKKTNKDIISQLSKIAVPLNDSNDLEEIIEAAGERELVLLGEASHGTYEYYFWRAEITKRLIKEKKFRFIAVEGDWIAIYRLNRYVKTLDGSLASADEVLQTFNRWPEWMWCNDPVLELAEWLREHNASLPPDERVGFFGIDLYGHWDALNDLLDYFNHHLSEQADLIRERLDCFLQYEDNELQYALEVDSDDESCSDMIQQIVDMLYQQQKNLHSIDRRKFFKAVQNTLVVRNAENFYRLAAHNSTASWNCRVDHMWETVKRLKSYYGEDSKGIVWAHNTHVGDSRATAMRAIGKYNIGELSREELGEEAVFILGFGSYRGRVNAANQWGDPMMRMKVPKAKKRTLDYYLGQVPYGQFYILLQPERREGSVLSEPLGHRAIGIAYNRHYDSETYLATLAAFRYDAILFINETTALIQ